MSEGELLLVAEVLVPPDLSRERLEDMHLRVEQMSYLKLSKLAEDHLENAGAWDATFSVQYKLHKAIECVGGWIIGEGERHPDLIYARSGERVFAAYAWIVQETEGMELVKLLRDSKVFV